MMIPVSFEKQILPRTFEHTLCHLIDHQIDMRIFENHYENDETGAPAYDPAILLKIILFAYSKGINSSRKIKKNAMRISYAIPGIRLNIWLFEQNLMST